MEQMKVLLGVVNFMNNTEALLDTVDELVTVSESRGIVLEDTGHTDAGDPTVEVVQGIECNDGERAILASYMSLMRQCIELAEKVEAAKA